MKIGRLEILNFKSIRHMLIEDIDYALILVGKNNTGKTVVLDAVRLVCGQYVPAEEDFTFPDQNIVITAQLLFEPEDYEELHSRGVEACVHGAPAVSKRRLPDIFADRGP